MEKSELSEEKVIKLGEKLVKELELENSNNTLGRWMAHYIAELMEKTKGTTDESEKALLKKECCDLILKAWGKKERLPIKQPLTDLEPIVDILESLKSGRPTTSIIWGNSPSIHNNLNLKDFVKLVKRNSELIFYKAVQIELEKIDLNKDRKWVEEYKEYLNKNEHITIGFLDTLEKVKKGEEKKTIDYLDRIECLLDEQKKNFQVLKEKYK